ncbi:MAG TPA: hypothetical protein VKB41_08450 [Steroidobacteraceae bacterium]|jgi:Spy/CpxP family protein refolding chaperone|nr:hypothetical protein [Steroidobacteraceae bacterium]
MRLTTLAVAASVLAAGVALADPPEGAPQGHHAMQGQHQAPIDRLTTELNLTPDQKEKVQKVLDDQRTKMQSMREQAQSSGQRPSRDEMRKQRDAMDQEVQAQLKPILTDEQMQKYQQMQQQRRSHAQGYHQGGHPEGSTPPPTQ